MIYNFGALDSDDEETAPVGQTPQTSEYISPEEQKQNEIKKLEIIRDQKRKELLQISKNVSKEDNEHQNRIKELQKQVLKLSNEAEQTRRNANQLEIQLKKMPVNKNQQTENVKTQNEVQNEYIRNLRLQTDILKTEIQKAKRVIAQEGCKNRALQIKKIKAQIEDMPAIGSNLNSPRSHTRNNNDELTPDEPLEYIPPSISDSPKSTQSHANANSGIDATKLRNQIGELTQEYESLNLKLRGLKSRVSILEKDNLKARVKKNLAISEQNDARIEKLKPTKIAMPTQKKYRGHISQQSRLQVVILGLHSELIERTKELNFHKVQPGEPGICKEIERLQKRLHLLESSLSCTV